MEERGGEFRRRQPEGTVLYAAVRDNLATLLAEASEGGRGLPRYVEREFARYPSRPMARSNTRPGSIVPSRTSGRGSRM